MDEGGETIVQRGSWGDCALGPVSWSQQVCTGGNQVPLKVRAKKARQESWPHPPIRDEMHIRDEMCVTKVSEEGPR